MATNLGRIYRVGRRLMKERRRRSLGFTSARPKVGTGAISKSRAYGGGGPRKRLLWMQRVLRSAVVQFEAVGAIDKSTLGAGLHACGPGWYGPNSTRTCGESRS